MRRQVPSGKVILEYNVHMDIHGKSGDAEAIVWWKSYPRIQCTHGHPRKVRGCGGNCLVEKLSKNTMYTWTSTESPGMRRQLSGGKVIQEYNVHMDIHGKSGDAEASA